MGFEARLHGPEAFSIGGGEMGARIRAFDWAATPLGPLEQWPQSLRSAVSILLPSKAQIAMFWGPDLITIYNDAYRPAFGSKHPWALGKPARECWSEVWEVIRPLFEGVVKNGDAFRAQDHPFFLERHGYVEETYFDVSYDPIRSESGTVGGIFCIVSETTRRVLGERRLKTLRDLGELSLMEAKTAEQVCRAAAATLAEDPRDFPFALIYLLDEDGRRARLCEAVSLSAGTKASPEGVAIDSDDIWNLRRVIDTNQSQILENLEGRFGRLPAGPWTDDWTKRALVLPLPKAGAQQLPAGFLVAGLSPRLAFNDDYRSFLELTAKQLATDIASSRAYEEERKRAEALAELDRAKTAFFSNVSHEFRTPLTLMLGPTEDALISPQRRLDGDALEVVHRNALRLQKLVNNLLDFSRIEAGRTQASYELTDLSVLTTNLASVFRSAIERAGLRLVVDCPPLDEAVYVDREMWEKIVLNLLSNALKFTFEGEIEVRLRPAHGHVEFVVRDTGTGIPQDEIPRLFERFHRVRDARARTHEGTGIGLALVQELVRLHGGTVTARSAVGAGSTFIVCIPTGSAHLPADRINADRGLAATATGAAAYLEEALRWLPGGNDASELPDHRGESVPSPPASAAIAARILLADDNADMREYVRRLLVQSGYDIEAVPDGLAAVRAARVRTPELVLADVMMPGLDGFGLLRELRADPRTATVPVVMLSARAGEEARVEGMEAGADDYLFKPFSARELLARIETHLKLQRARRETQAALRASEAKFATAFHQSPLALTITSLDDGRLIEVNEGFVRLSGYTREDAVGRTPAELRLWLEPERHAEGLARLRVGESISDVEARFRTKTGDELVGVISSSVIRINSRPHVLSSVADITERKKVEAERDRLFAVSLDLLCVATLDGYFKRINPAFVTTLGWSESELLARPFIDLVHPDDIATTLAEVRKLQQGAQTPLFENRWRCRDGSYRWLAWTAAPYVAEGLFYAVARDITDRKQREERLRQDLATERGIAETLQRSLLPDRLPRIEGVGLAARYIPASPETVVGGDFYDVFTLPDGKLGLAIGDVAGHGVQAATAMGQVRMLLRALTHEGDPPAVVIDRLNRLLGSGEMVTVLYLVLDPNSGLMTYANAGHTPPLVVSPEGTGRFLYGANPPLVGGSHQYNNFTATVAPSSTVILYTDGLVESEKSIELGLTRLSEVSGRLASASLETAADAIVTQLVEGATRRDDVALLAFRLQHVDPKRFRIVLPAVPPSLRTLRVSLRRWLEAGGVSPQGISDIVVASGEAATNAVEHAYGPGDGVFEVEAMRDTDRIVLRIRDKGMWRPRRAGEGGRGLMIMRHLMDTVDVVRDAEGTTVQLERRQQLPAEV